MSFLRWIGPEQFDAFWATNWKSPQGQAWAHGTSPLVLWFKARLKARPFYVAAYWRPDIQRKHFAQMWGQVFDRRYDNLALQDLYWVHELAHWASMTLEPSRTHAEWAQKWDDNELMSSFISEVLVHGESADWDRAALGSPAWARQFPSISAQDPLDPSTWSQGATLAWERRVSVRAGQTAPNGQTEIWLASFAAENARWASIWSEHWTSIDAGLNAYRLALAAGDEAGMRAALDDAGRVGQWPTIPYLDEALAFARMLHA